MPRRPAPRLDLRLLGPPEVTVDGRPIEVDTRKAIAILAILAADARPYAREELAALLWPASDETAAHGALRRTLSVMRVIDGEALRIERMRVTLDRERAWIDLAEVERLASRGSRADLAAAAALARGPFLAGFNLRDSPEFDDWRAARAVAVERLILGVLDRLAVAAEAAGDADQAIGAAARRLDLDPLDEGAHVRLMELHARSGDRAAAVRQYRACVAVLERELGVAPLATTTARYEAIRDAMVVDDRSSGDVPPAISRDTAVRPRGDVLSAADARTLPLIGRDGPADTIESAITAIDGDGRGRLVVVTGEAGIGKTRLGDAAAQRIRAAGGTVLVARGHRTEASIPYGAIVDLLRAAMREPQATQVLERLDPSVRTDLARLVPAVEPAGRRKAVAAGVDATAEARLVGAIVDGLGGLAAGDRPGALWVDDVQWVDPASVQALTVLARRLAERPLLLVLAWRDEDVPSAGTAASRTLAGLADARISLDRLEPAAADEFVDRLAPEGLPPAERTRIREAAEGLPLYLVEALAAARGGVAGSVPPGVRDVLLARLDGIDEMARQVLAAAAIIGRTFDVATVRHASGRSEEETVDALDGLAAAAIVRAGPAGYDFAHGALRDLVDEGIGLARRRLLHRRVAEALRLDLGGLGRDDLGRRTGIALHERLAGRTAEAAEAYGTAAEGAADVFAHQLAIDHAEAALALGHPDAARLHTLIGRAHTRLGDYAGAIASLEAAAAQATPGRLVAIEWEIGRVRLRKGDLSGADRHLAAVAEAADADPAVVARAWVDRSVVRRRSGDTGGAIDAGQRGLDIASRAGDAAAAGAARRMLGLCALDEGDTDRAIVELDDALEAARGDRDPTARIAALVGLALATAARGETALALAHGSAALDECRRIGDRHLEAAVDDHLADLLHAAGRDDAAREHQRRAAAAFAALGGEPTDPDPGVWMLAAW